jgi:hypothetical protein
MTGGAFAYCRFLICFCLFLPTLTSLSQSAPTFDAGTATAGFSVTQIQRHKVVKTDLLFRVAAKEDVPQLDLSLSGVLKDLHPTEAKPGIFRSSGLPFHQISRKRML